MEIVGMKNATVKVKHSLDGLKSRRLQRIESVTLRTEQQNFFNLNKREKIDEEKYLRVSGTCWTITKVLIFISLKSLKEKGEWDLKWIQRNNGWKYPKFGKIHEPTDSRSSVRPKQEHLKISTPTHIINDLHKLKIKKKILKAARKINALPEEGHLTQMIVKFSSEIIKARRK